MAIKSGKLVLGFLVYGFTLCVVLSAIALFWIAHQFQKSGPVDMPTLFVVEKGVGGNAIAHQLYAENLIHDPFIFMIGMTALGQHTKMKAGEYEIQPGMSARDIVYIMSEGKVVDRKVTIREGLTSYEVVRLLKSVEELKQNDSVSIPAEGTLLPETYGYQLGDSVSDVLAQMETSMRETIETLWAKRDQNLPYETIEDMITMASIIEKETGKGEERRRVAGVFVNRLRKGMALQTDPTVIYAITKGKHKNDGKGPLGRRLLKKDLEYDSPYNTYKYPGLPPGPIANPGRASIEAALNPEEHDYIFFVADGTGGHLFAKTLKEHNQNVANWRKIRRKQKK